MKCFVYKSPKKPDTYIFLCKKNEFGYIPKQLLDHFGTPEFALEFDLDEKRKLAFADAKQVLAKLGEQGYYLQLPPQNKLAF